MPRYLRSDSQISKFILDAALNQEPVFEAYRKLCRLHPNLEIDYVDFEWKYYQVYHGNQDERSPLTFSDLPVDVLGKVVEKLALVDCLSLQKVSRDLRNLVESNVVQCKFMKIELEDDSSNFFMKSFQVNCKQVPDGLWEWRTLGQSTIADAKTFLKNPKLKINRLSIIVNKIPVTSDFLEFLKLLNVQLDVRSISISKCEGFITPIISYLKPGNLEKIDLGDGELEADEFNKLAETEQWQNAKKLYFRPFLQKIKIEECLHFEKIEILNLDYSDDQFIAIKDLLFKSDNLTSCSLNMLNFTLEVLDDMGWIDHEMDDSDGETFKQKVDRIMIQDPAYNARTHRFSIPNSRDYFQLGFKTEHILMGVVDLLTIEKVSKKR